jgi:anti-sigma B factor antagonist
VTGTTAVTGEERDGWYVVAVTGEIDVHTGPVLREHLLGALTSGRHEVVVDLSGVSFLDSSGLGVLVTAHKRARAAGGELRLASCQPAVATIFQITALDRALSIHPTVAQALAVERLQASGIPTEGPT